MTSKADNLRIVFVLGESVRADHLSLNGYKRETNPFLSQQKNLISFKNVYTPLTYTAVSVPQILTDKSIIDNDKINLTSLFSLLNKASFNTEWIGNQSLEKSYEDIVKTNNKVTIIDEFHSFLSFKKEKDIMLLKPLITDASKPENKMITLHMIGSHWYYNSRFDEDFAIFKPMVSSKFVGSSSKEQLINSYDNTLLYLDFFLNELIEKLKKSSKKTVLIYLSDHGEILGEDGKWFHAQSHKSSENPAMLIWYSDAYKNENQLKIDKLHLRKEDSISTDFFYHSILDLAKIENFSYDKNLSIFNVVEN